MAGINTSDDIDEMRKFGLLFSVVLALLSWSFLWKDRSGGFLFTLIAFSLLAVTLFKPILLKSPYRLWMKVAGVLGQVMTKVILTLLFFLVFTPIGLVTRFLNRDFLAVKMPKNGASYWEKGPNSYWVPRKDGENGVEQYEKQY